MQITYRYIEVNVFTIVSTVRIKPHTLIKSVQILSLACRLSRSLEFMFLVHLDQTNALTWRPSSVNFSHFKLLLRNHWANWNQLSRNVP